MMPKAARRLNLDIKGIVTMTVALVSFMIAITNSGKLPDGIISFAVFLIIGAVSLILFLKVERKAKNPLVPLKLLMQPAILQVTFYANVWYRSVHHRNCYPQLVLPHWVLV